MHQVVERGKDFVFAFRIQGGCGLVQNDKRRIPIQRPGDGDLLRFAAADIAAVFIQAVQICMKLLGHLPDAFPESCLGQAVPDLRLMHGLPRCNIFSHGEGKQAEILKYHRKQRELILVAIISDVHAVEGNFALCGFVQPAQELDKGGLPGSVFPHDGGFGTGRDSTGNILQSV